MNLCLHAIDTIKNANFYVNRSSLSIFLIVVYRSLHFWKISGLIKKLSEG